MRRDSENTIASYFVSSLMNLFGKSLKENMTVEKLMQPIRYSVGSEETVRKADEEYLRERFNL